ncbi:unnamed protein product [Nyctereutes procyonoides]|uniref:Mitochondrial glutathione transporter SLC25A39 n=1 Tax=Nyctereutes procyonoides TaxID=34880 RepID=A0A811XZ22_NYCPR|nr:unnamed protein product [Nyctereutes procyonoides]
MPPSRLWSLSYTKLPSSLPSTGKCLLYCSGVLEPLYLCPRVPAVPPGFRTLPTSLAPWTRLPATAIYFTAYDQLRTFLCGRALTSDLYSPMPLELVRTKLQAQHVSYRELGTCVRATVAQGGWRSLWLSWGPTALRDVPFSALYWFNYELVKGWLSGLRPKHQTSVGTVAVILTLPFDVVMTQRQVARVTPPGADSTWLLLRRIRAESGTRGLFAGFLPRIIKGARSCAFMISTYEFCKSFFQRLNREQPLGP